MEKLKNKYVLFFFMAHFILPIYGQYLPKDEAKLNYNQIYFEYPYNENATFYKLFLAIDSTEIKTNFKSCLYNTYFDKTPATRIEGLKFGKNYKWYIETHLKTGEKISSDIHFFSILNSGYTDTSKFKVKQNYNKSSKIEQGLIWCDHLHCVLNRKGEVVWFIPEINKDFKESRTVRDFRLQNDGTITFLSEPEAYHTDRNLNVIWKGPNTGKISQSNQEFYHHSFEKLDNGNYMTLGNDVVELERIDTKDSVSREIEFATLIEYNKDGKIVWFWKMQDCFPFDLLASETENKVLNPHCNSFSIDKTTGAIYLGFRDISRIIKIDKQSKKIVASYGKKLNKTDTTVFETTIFRHPHDMRILDNNEILLLNNNDVTHENISSTELFSLPQKKGEKFRSIWSFKFNFDSINDGKSVKLGGNKIMTNGNVLINEGAINRIIEVNKNKEVLWDLTIFKRDSVGKWKNFPQYRANFSLSLYPYLFSLGIADQTQKHVNLIVFNEGDFTDNYICELYNSEGKLLFSKTIKNIKKFKKIIVTIDLSKYPGKFLKIKSINSGISKEIHFSY